MFVRACGCACGWVAVGCSAADWSSAVLGVASHGGLARSLPGAKSKAREMSSLRPGRASGGGKRAPRLRWLRVPRGLVDGRRGPLGAAARDPSGRKADQQGDGMPLHPKPSDKGPRARQYPAACIAATDSGAEWVVWVACCTLGCGGQLWCVSVTFVWCATVCLAVDQGGG